MTTIGDNSVSEYGNKFGNGNKLGTRNLIKSGLDISSGGKPNKRYARDEWNTNVQ